MLARWNLLILALYISSAVVLSKQPCSGGFIPVGKECEDYDECADPVPPCGQNSTCINTPGSFTCRCVDGFGTSPKRISAKTPGTCKDINECLDAGLCGQNTKCINRIPHYFCVCDNGFNSSTGMEKFRRSHNVTCRDVDECEREKVCGSTATCVNTPGGYLCVCNAGFELKSGNADLSGSPQQCEVLNCGIFNKTNLREFKEFHVAYDFAMHMAESCLQLTESENPTALDGDNALQKLLSAIDGLLSGSAIKDNRRLTAFLDMVENSLRIIGPFVKPPGSTRSTTHTELKMLVHKGVDLPQGTVTLSTTQAQLGIQLEAAAGDPSYYPGYTTVSLLSYANLEDSADGFFSGMKSQADQRFKIISRIVTATVSNRNTSHLKEPVVLTFHHPKQSTESRHICVFWDSSEEGGAWSPRGCSVAKSNPEYTVCSCNHLSSFAVLLALYEIEDKYELQLITWVGLSLSLTCLFICILTFSSIRSIQSPRTTIHLNLCISLFIGTLIFIVGISRTENRAGCAVVAGLLHFFYLAAFCWMCLEGIQLFRMVVLVFNTNFKPLYMMAGGYGVPAVIVSVSALANTKGYGTEKYCWLNLELIWSFFGPACVIIIVNIFFFLITVWKLAQKFSSLNPDLDKLQKIKTFTITAVAQLCVLGTMWIFGCFQFEEGTIIMSYLFTIFGSLQGVMLFVMHCLFSKQVREEYGNILSRLCATSKEKYSQFSWSNSAKTHPSKSTELQNTEESNM